MLGIYDSGIGGLAYLKELMRVEPDIDFIYLADNKYLPLGEKSLDEIQEIVQKGVEKLFESRCNLVILACNTATVNTIRYLQQVWLKEQGLEATHRILGIGQPLLEMLEESPKEFQRKKGLILATPATYKSGFYQSEVKQRGFTNLNVIACYGLADVIEQGESVEISKKINQILNLNHINTQDIEYVILGCTHYVWAISEIEAAFLPDISILNPSQIAVKKLQKYLLSHPTFHQSNGYKKFYLSDNNSKLKYENFLRYFLKIESEFKLIT